MLSGDERMELCVKAALLLELSLDNSFSCRHRVVFHRDAQV